jgi:translation elongation factor P/translation initiation factor 5A
VIAVSHAFTPTAMIEKKPAQFTYKDDNNNFFFMDSETFDEVAVGEK